MNNQFGFLNIDKPKGVTSHDCVREVRKLFGLKRVGHGGTLDPSVTGVLPIAIGEATRLFPYLPEVKTYQGIIQLGKRTITDDLDGEILTSNQWPAFDDASLEALLTKFCGKIKQKPPRVSSVHIQGERAYKRARRGEEFDLPEKLVTINELSLLNWNPTKGEVEIKVKCSSGTYIRSIARDFGESIGCGGCLATLRRTQSLGFTQNQSIQLEELLKTRSTKYDFIIPPLIALQHLPSFQIKKEDDLIRWRTGRELRNLIINQEYLKGNRSESEISKEENYIVILGIDKSLYGIGILTGADIIKPKIVFNAIG